MGSKRLFGLNDAVAVVEILEDVDVDQPLRGEKGGDGGALGGADLDHQAACGVQVGGGSAGVGFI